MIPFRSSLFSFPNNLWLGLFSGPCSSTVAEGAVATYDSTNEKEERESSFVWTFWWKSAWAPQDHDEGGSRIL